jgi:hypothetical protein
MKKSEVIDLVAALRDRFPRQAKDFSSKNAQAYCEDLLDLEFGTAFVAVKTLAATCDWFPSIAEIRRAYSEIVSPIPDADEAWSAALKYGNKIGWGNHREFDLDTGGFKPLPPCELHEAVIEAVEGLGGWKELGRSTNQEIDRAHFLKLYKGTKERHVKREVSKSLVDATGQKLLRGEHGAEDETPSEESANVKRLGRR